jgi:DNA polymerase I
MSQKKLFLLDAFALIYRAHFAFSKNPRINSKGFNTGAILGFVNVIVEILTKEKPTHIGICFDSPGKTFRHDDFPEYKANRDAQPEEITASIPVIFQVLDAMQIPYLKLAGFEADDIAGTIAKKAQAAGIETYLLTTDKDYAQLVDEKIFMYKPNFLGKGYEVLGIPEVLAKWDIERVDQIIDFLGLQGDAVDNIPGIKGVGAKTAVTLLKQYGTVENIVANAHNVKGKLGEKIAEFGAMGIKSKELATIDINVPIEFNEKELEYNGPNADLLGAIFDELEFRTLKAKILGTSATTSTSTASTTDTKKTTKQAAAPSGQMSLFDAPPAGNDLFEEIVAGENTTRKSFYTSTNNYQLIEEEADIKELIGYLQEQKEFCFDTETTSLEAIEAKLVGLAISYIEGEAFYIPFPKDQIIAQARIDLFKEVLANENITKIGQNIKYDILVLKNYNIEVKGSLFDTMLAHYLLYPDKRHNMDTLALDYLNYETIHIEELIGKKGAKQGNMADLEPSEIVNYACEDADITLQLKNKFVPWLEKRNQVKLFNEVETALIPVLATMESNGVRIDTEALHAYSKELVAESLEIQTKIFEIAGIEFNLSSPKQLGEILFDKLKLDPKAKKTKTGQYATGEEILSEMAHEHEIAALILDFRELQKLNSTYVEKMPENVSKIDGKIHTSYNQAVAATGRLSSVNPNLQNIPIRTARGREIRKAFIASDEDHILYAADYSQIELRIMAAFSQDQSMIDSFNKGLDIHSNTASKVFGVPLEEVT